MTTMYNNDKEYDILEEFGYIEDLEDLSDISEELSTQNAPIESHSLLQQIHNIQRQTIEIDKQIKQELENKRKLPDLPWSPEKCFKLINNPYENGCSLAALSFALGISLDNVYKLAYEVRAYDPSKGTEYWFVKDILAYNEWKCINLEASTRIYKTKPFLDVKHLPLGQVIIHTRKHVIYALDRVLYDSTNTLINLKTEKPTRTEIIEYFIPKDSTETELEFWDRVHIVRMHKYNGRLWSRAYT